MDQRSRKLNRLRGFDYSQSGYYYITICTKDRIHWFGSAINGKMDYSPLGLFTIRTYINIPQFYTDVSIDKYVIMPNHIHGIIVVRGRVGTEQCSVPTVIRQCEYTPRK